MRGCAPERADGIPPAVPDLSRAGAEDGGFRLADSRGIGIYHADLPLCPGRRQHLDQFFGLVDATARKIDDRFAGEFFGEGSQQLAGRLVGLYTKQGCIACGHGLLR